MVLSPSGASPTTPSGISPVSSAASTACCNLNSYFAFPFSYFSTAFSSLKSSGTTGYLIPETKASDFLNICSSWKRINSKTLQIP